ncbi:MAG: alpha-glucuronidase family glycosyl hydrolase, partial [Verrucomicrobiota bacterium]
MKSPARTALRLLALLVTATLSAHAETGYDGWLRYAPITDASVKRGYETTLPDTVVVLGDSPILKSAQAELVRGVSAMLGRTLTVTNSAELVGKPNQLGGKPVIVLGTSDRISDAISQETTGFSLTILPSFPTIPESFGLSITQAGG